MSRIPARVVATLRELLHPAADSPVQQCELCDAELEAVHTHIVDIATRRLLCACGACGRLHEAGPLHSGPSGGRPDRLAIPRRYAHHSSMTFSASEWLALGIPVDLAFFFFNSRLGRAVAFYPGPAGAIESLLPLDQWARLASAHPWISGMAPDVEALLVRKQDGQHRCFVVPVDACYELVGRIRSHWSGFGGGDRVRAEIDGFTDAILNRGGPDASPAAEQPRAEPR